MRKHPRIPPSTSRPGPVDPPFSRTTDEQSAAEPAAIAYPAPPWTSRKYPRGLGGALSLAFVSAEADAGLSHVPTPRGKDRPPLHARSRERRAADLRAYIFDRARYVVPAGEGFVGLYSCEQIAANARRRGRYGMRALSAARVRALLWEVSPALARLRGEPAKGAALAYTSRPPLTKGP